MLLSSGGRVYFSQAPELFARRLKIPDNSLLHCSEIMPTDRLGSPINQEFHAYWLELAEKEGGIPNRKSFSPAQARRVLPYIMLVEQTGEDYRVRLTGTEVDRALGFVAGGRLVSELAEVFATRWPPIYRRVLGDRKPFLYRKQTLGSELSSLEVEAISVPFHHHSTEGTEPSAEPTLVMTCFDICTLN